MDVCLAILTVIYLCRLQSRIEEKVPIVQHFLDYAAFALIIPKLGSAIDWDWLFVLSPLLAQTMHRYLKLTVLLVEAIAIKLSGSEEAGNRLCDRLLKKHMETHDRKMRALDGMRKQFAHY